MKAILHAWGNNPHVKPEIFNKVLTKGFPRRRSECEELRFSSKPRKKIIFSWNNKYPPSIQNTIIEEQVSYLHFTSITVRAITG